KAAQSIIPNENIQIQPTLFVNRISRWPNRATRRDYRKRKPVFPDAVAGYRPAFPGAITHPAKKIPDAVF
ncbi:MAG: hypothetical protein ACLFS1_09575, partial [Opitutales bacterium]